MTARPLSRVSATKTPWHPRPDALGFTMADLHAPPDDGLRYELIGGSLIVSPSATAWPVRIDLPVPSRRWAEYLALAE